MNTMLLLVRREFWEHRSLWIAPVVWAGIIVVLSAWLFFFVLPNHLPDGILHSPNVEAIEGISDRDREEIRQALEAAKTHDVPKATVSISFLGISQLISAFTCIVVFFYLIDCLFTERRDRSILFWKSLPLSDTQVVLSKFAVALVAVPLGVVLLATVTQFLLYSLFWLQFHDTVLAKVMADWSFSSWMRALAVEFAVLFCGVLWYAPIAAYFLLLSVWARKLVFLWAIVPFIAIPVLEWVFFQSSHVGEFIGQRFGGFVELMHLDTAAFNLGVHDSEGPHISDVLASVDVSGVLTSLETWMGLLAAAVMGYATIRIRRYRDDS